MLFSFVSHVISAAHCGSLPLLCVTRHDTLRSPSLLAAADCNGDGLRDIVVGDADSGAIVCALRLNASALAWGAAAGAADVAVGSQDGLVFLVGARLDADTTDDILCVTMSAHTVFSGVTVLRLLLPLTHLLSYHV